MLKEVLTVSALIAVVLLVRAIFKNRVPKRMLYALWLVVLLKLCLPGTLVSLPVLPAEDAAVPAQSAERPVQTAPVIQRPAQTVTKPQTPAQQPVSPVQETAKPAAKPLTTAQILQIAWFSGSALLGLWLFGAWAVFTIRLHRDRRFLGKRGGTCIYVSGAVKSPCLAGLIPAVYLTEDVLQTDEAELIVRHELTHLRHLDFLWSLCRTAAVTVYWWNPFIWIAAICSKRDAELACDEAVAAKLPESKRLAYARAILAQAPRKTAALSLAGPPVKERILFLTKKQRTSVLCVILALLLVASATGCSFAELTQQKSDEITMPEDAEAAHQEALKDVLETATSLTQEQIDAVNAVFADYALSTDDTLGHFAVNGFFTSTYDDVRDLNLNDFLAYFGECGEDDISEEEFAQLNAKWGFRVDSVADCPLPIHRYPASAVESVLQRFAGIGLADLKDIQEPFSDYLYLEETDAFYNTTSDYSPGAFTCTSGSIDAFGEYVELIGWASRFPGESILRLVKDGENWRIHSFTLEIPADELPVQQPEAVISAADWLAFADKWRLDYLPVFSRGAAPASTSSYLMWVFARNMNALKEQGYMTKSYVETEIQSHFEVGNLTHEGLAKTWDFNGETYTAVPGGVKDRPLARLDGITTAEENGRLVYYVQYTLVQPDYLVLSNQEWQVLAEQVARGDFANLQELGSYTVCFTYENDEPVFLSHTELPSAALSSEEIWLRVHEKLDYAPWAQEMTEEYIAVLQKFEIEDSRLSEQPGDVSQFPHYYSAFIDYFSGANADLQYLDADAVWTKDLSEDGQTMIVTMTWGDVSLTLHYSLQTQEISVGDNNGL